MFIKSEAVGPYEWVTAFWIRAVSPLARRIVLTGRRLKLFLAARALVFALSERSNRRQMGEQMIIVMIIIATQK